MIFVWHCFLSTRIALGTDTSFIEDITRCWKASIKIWEKGSRKSSDKHVCCNMARIICSHSNRKLTLGSVWYMEALGTLGAPSQVYFTGKYKHCNVQGCSWGEASSCESVHWARHISSDGIWHLDKRCSPSSLLDSTDSRECYCNVFPNTLYCKGQRSIALEIALF